LNDEKSKLENFQKQMQEIVIQLSELGVTVQNDNALGKLTSKSLEVAEKQRCIDWLKEQIQECRDKLIEKNALLSKELKNVQNECTEQNNIIESCNKNRMNYSDIQEQVELINEINRELKKRGIREEAHMAYEYVIELKDENWRNAIEAFLGIHRYAVIVSRELFDIANAVLDKSKYRYVELVNTRRLMSREMDCEEDSVFHYLAIQNETAANYFKFWLGRIHAVNIEDVPNYDNAMSKEGKLSRNMAVTYINTRKIRNYCLGSQAIELNRKAAEKRLRELESNEKEILLEQKDLHNKSEYLKAGLACFKEFNLNSHKEWAKVSEDLNDERGHYKDLLEAQKNNAEFMALNERVSILGSQLDSKKKERDENIKQKTILETMTLEKEKTIKTSKVKEIEKQEELDEERIASNSAVEKAIEEYDAYLSGDNKNGGLMVYDTKMRVDRRVRELEGNINGKQQAYNNRKQEADRLPVGLNCEADYQRRRGKIWIDDLQGIQQKLKEQTITYERIFKREFVLNIYNAAKEAKDDISDINKELRKLQFSTKYQFDVKMLNDNSDYAKILRYAEYLQETNNMSDGQMTFTSLMGYENDEVETREKEIRDIINKIIEHNDISEIKKFADYRNYMSYEIIINNDEVKDGKLSKQVGYNSGAGTQIPYTLILSAALSMLYNARVNSVRLIFIDEPFEKMSDHNIKLMLDFFKNQDFQVIFCAPPNKLESIGSECGVIIPVLKYSNDNMQIGEIRFHEQ
jgi:predicted transcriptional regulator